MSVSCVKFKFNASKCKVMHIGHNLGTKYHIEDEDGMTELQEVAEERDLGVKGVDILNCKL